MIARMRMSGLVLAAIALASQIALGAVILGTPSVRSEAATLASVSLFCHAGNSKPAPRHAPAQRLSALAQAVAGAASLLGPGSPCLPAPTVPALLALHAAAPRAPPRTVRIAAHPRGPPALA